MIGRKGVVLVVLALLLVLTGVSGWSVYGVWRQARKNAELIAAIKKGDIDTVNFLLERGADATTRDTTDRGTFWQQIRDLRLHRMHRDIGTPALALALQRYSAYDATSWERTEPFLLVLIKHGADPNVKDAERMTPLLYGCLYNDRSLVQMALAQGAEVNIRSLIGTPLMVAAMKGRTEMVQTLLAYGANVNLKTDNGETALVCAFGDYNPPLPFNAATVMKMLLAHGADVNVKNVHGDTPLKMAVDCHRPDLVSLLKRYGAKK